MSRWTKQFKEHPFFSKYAQILTAIEQIKLPAGSDVDISLEVARLKKVLHFVMNYLESCDPEFFPFHILDQIQAVAEGINNHINQYLANNEVAHLRGANDDANQFIGHISNIPTIYKTPKALGEGIRAYQETTQLYLGQIKTETDRILSDLQNVKTEADKAILNISTQKDSLATEVGGLRDNITQQTAASNGIKTTLEQELNIFRQAVQSEQTSLRQGLEKISSDFQSTFSQNQDQRSKEFTGAQEERSREFNHNQDNRSKEFITAQENRSKEFIQSQDQRNKEFNDLQEERSKEFSDNAEKFDTKMNDKFLEMVQKSNAIIELLEKFKEQAKKVLGVVLNTAQAGVYKTYADEEKVIANFFRRWASCLMLFAIVILVGPEVKAILFDGLRNAALDWHDWLYRVPVAVILFGPAFYFSRESNKHRNNEDSNRKMENILCTVDPYLELLDPSKKDELKAELARKLFDPNANSLQKSDDVDENFVKQVASFLSKLNKFWPKNSQ